MRTLKVKYFNDESALSAFVDRLLAKKHKLSIQPTTNGYTVCY